MNFFYRHTTFLRCSSYCCYIFTKEEKIQNFSCKIVVKSCFYFLIFLNAYAIALDIAFSVIGVIQRLVVKFSFEKFVLMILL